MYTRKKSFFHEGGRFRRKKQPRDSDGCGHSTAASGEGPASQQYEGGSRCPFAYTFRCRLSLWRNERSEGDWVPARLVLLFFSTSSSSTVGGGRAKGKRWRKREGKSGRQHARGRRLRRKRPACGIADARVLVCRWHHATHGVAAEDKWRVAALTASDGGLWSVCVSRGACTCGPGHAGTRLNLERGKEE